MKIVVRGTNWVGDAVMTIPALRTLRATFPEAEILLLTRNWAEGVFRDAGFIDRILSYRPTGSKRRDLAAQRRLLSSERPDAAILFTNSFESALALSLARIPARFGYSKEGRGFLLSDAIDVPKWKDERHESEYYLNLVREAARRLGRESAARSFSAALPVSEARRAEAFDLLASHGIDTSRPIVVLGAGSTNSDAKRWPALRFAALCDLFKEKYGANVVLLGTKAETGVAREVWAHSERKPADLCGATSLAEAAAILSLADIVVSNDMGLAHVAPAVGAPTLVIFGPTNDRTTRPIGSEIIRKPFDCAPCMLRECPIDHRCMTSISPEEVFAKASAMIGNKF